MAEKSDMSQAAKGSSRLLVEERKVLGRNSVADGIAVWGKASVTCRTAECSGHSARWAWVAQHVNEPVEGCGWGARLAEWLHDYH